MWMVHLQALGGTSTSSGDSSGGSSSSRIGHRQQQQRQVRPGQRSMTGQHLEGAAAVLLMQGKPTGILHGSNNSRGAGNNSKINSRSRTQRLFHKGM